MMSHKILLSKIVLLSIASAVLLDFLVSTMIIGFEYQPTRDRIKTYFNYGVSTSRKLLTHTGIGDKQPHSIAIAGWNNQLPEREAETKDECHVPTTFYGMSFSNRIAEQLVVVNRCVSVRQIAGPGAPLSHSYFMATKHAQNDDAAFAILGVLASSLPKVTTMAHFNSAFEFPGAHMYPRYTVSSNGNLLTTEAPAENLGELKALLNDEESKRELTQLLSQKDAYFNNFVFSFSWLDYSNIAKMLRRSYAQKNKREIVAKLFSNGKYTSYLDLRETSRQLVVEFAKIARENNQTPVIILINDKGYSEALDELLIDTIEKHDISYITSSHYIDTKNLNNFEADGHFTPENDLKLARALEKLIFKNKH